MGAIFTVALARFETVAELPGCVVALDPRADDPLGPALPSGPTTVLVGAERGGLAPDVLAGAARTVRIPIAGDSLNAAMAATVALYELTRARRISDP
jgi:TrmH family RNA methyltransferase